jgi:hypothetical protein
MLFHDPALDALVNTINGTTGFLSSLLSRKSGLVLILVIGAAVTMKLVF